ncbi:MAG: hypothetical protein OYH77_06430 [Pseudomonadota bacterium]|nr:hypothetical protein [Pseudomonadota bacterium]
MRTAKLVAVLAITAWANTAIGHPGGLNPRGCHAGSQPYHCHGGSSSTSSTEPINFAALIAIGVVVVGGVALTTVILLHQSNSDDYYQTSLHNNSPSIHLNRTRNAQAIQAAISYPL